MSKTIGGRFPFRMLAAYADIIDGINLDTVDHYREQLQANETLKAVKLHPMNIDGYYVIEDGHHRILATMLEGLKSVCAEVDGNHIDISWRYPRILPLTSLIPDLKFIR